MLLYSILISTSSPAAITKYEPPFTRSVFTATPFMVAETLSFVLPPNISTRRFTESAPLFLTVALNTLLPAISVANPERSTLCHVPPTISV